MTHPQYFDQHLLPLWADEKLQTPAFVYDFQTIQKNLDNFDAVREAGGKLLYSIKAVPLTVLLNSIADKTDGFSTSSLFEALHARDVLQNRGTVHLTSPGISPDNFKQLNGICDYFSFNSLTQWQCNGIYKGAMKCGLRINPGLSFARDIRFDPCRNGSKLGIPLDQFSSISWDSADDITGLHIHNNCESENYSDLVQTVEILIDKYPEILKKINWINLGGGYITIHREQIQILTELIKKLRKQYVDDVFVEPGKAIVGRAGYLVASVIDIFDSGNKKIAVLDTTVNHLPEVFEYQYSPLILQSDQSGSFEYRIAGASCLSGDLFGDYRFHRKLEPGSKIIFANVGAYMLVKANSFNGINLPNIYMLGESGKLELHKEFSYSDYRQRW